VSLEEAINKSFNDNGIVRIKAGDRPPASSRGNLAFTFNPTLNVPAGDSYVIVTDQIDPTCLESLNKLARFHSGKILEIRNFRNLYKMPGARAQLVERLREANPKFVAFAPRTENFSENVVLAVWQLLLRLGDGKLTVYPSYLVARNSKDLDALVSKSINRAQLHTADLHPVVIAQATDEKSGGMRSVQKAVLTEDLFHELGVDCPGLVIRTKSAPPPLEFPKIATLGTLSIEQAGHFIEKFPPAPTRALSDARLILLFGHGLPGMTCSFVANAFENIPMQNDIVLCGSCFSATPPDSDLLKNSNGTRAESLAFQVIADGAQVFYGHMHENSGFPQLFVAFEALMKGQSVGESFQQMMNTVIDTTKVPQDRFVMSEDELADEQAVKQRNGLLFVMIGDPAAQPIAPSLEKP